MFPTIANHNPTTAMNKRLLIIATALFLSLPSARAQLIVEDVLSIAQDAVNQRRRPREVRRDGQQPGPADQHDDAGASADGRLRQSLRRSGAAFEITGVNELMSELDLSGVGQTLGEIRQTASGIQSLKNNATGLYQEITDFSLSGIEVPRVPDIYKPFSARGECFGQLHRRL